jgi:hypothetical protein
MQSMTVLNLSTLQLWVTLWLMRTASTNYSPQPASFQPQLNYPRISPPFVLALSMLAMKGTDPPRSMASDSNNDTCLLQPDEGNSKPAATPGDLS